LIIPYCATLRGSGIFQNYGAHNKSYDLNENISKEPKELGEYTRAHPIICKERQHQENLNRRDADHQPAPTD
jgi:hypothetical protein